MISGWLSLPKERQAAASVAQSNVAAEVAKAPLSTGSITEQLTGLEKTIGLFLLLGLLARVIRYYLCFPLWDDESFLCVNLIHRGYADLLQPLDYHQVAPILFLWIERTIVGALGFSEYSLRLLPLVCSIASLFVFHRVARQLLSGPALLFAVAIFAVSYPGIRYAAEAKPYGTDMFVSLLMLWSVVEWQQHRGARTLGLLAVAMPFALGLSYPAVFAAGGLSLIVGSVLWTSRGTRQEWFAWCAWNLTLVASFVFWFRMVGSVQSGAEGEFMGEYWKQNFPPVAQPWLVPYWLLKTHASDFLAYPFGGPNWASTGTLLLCTAGLWHLASTRQRFWLGLLLCPAGLHLLAAALQKYPYGGHVKFSQYLAPMICCLAGVGIAQFVDFISRRQASTVTAMRWACMACFAIGAVAITRDLANPYKTRSDFRARAFAESFWPGVHTSEEVVCVKSDLGLDFVPQQHHQLSWSAHYFCNRAIEISRSRLHPADFSHVSASRPLRCVIYHDKRFPLDQTQLDHWLAEMRQKYDLVAHESMPFARMAKDDRKLLAMESIDSYKFVPLGTSANGSPPLAKSREPSHH